MAPDLIPQASLDRVGELLCDPVTVTLDRRESQRYAYAVGDENPVYFDVEAALAAGHRGLICPPTFVSHAIVAPRSAGELREDGLYNDVSVELNVSRMMFGGEEWDFETPAHVGDEITAETRLAALDQKDGSKGPFVRVVRETTYTDQDGVVVARARQIGIAR